MFHVSPKEIFQIVRSTPQACVTIYCQNKEKLHSLIEEATQICERDMQKDELENFTGPLFTIARNKNLLLEDFPIGVFITKGFIGFSKIPFSVKDLVVVARSFHLKPLIKWAQLDKSFYVLTFQKQSATLLKGSLTEMSFVDKIEFCVDKKFMSKNMEFVDQFVMSKIYATDLPLIVHGYDVHREFYLKYSRYNLLFDSGRGEPLYSLNEKSFRNVCRDLVAPFDEFQESKALRQYQAAKRGGQVSFQLHEILHLALHGKVKHLFVNESIHIWGQINYETGRFTYHPKQLNACDDDILDDIAEIVLSKNGRVTVLPNERMPDRHAAAAILHPSSTFLSSSSEDQNLSSIEKKSNARASVSNKSVS